MITQVELHKVSVQKRKGKRMKSNGNGCTDGAFCGSEVKPLEMGEEDAAVSGVFANLTNKTAFIDKSVIGILGKLRKRFSKKIDKTVNFAIGGSGRPYARSLHGIYAPT